MAAFAAVNEEEAGSRLKAGMTGKQAIDSAEAAVPRGLRKTGTE